MHRELDSWADIHTARMYMVETTKVGEQRMLDEEALPAARRVATVEPDVIAFGCTSASSLHGRDYDEEFRQRLSRETGVPVLGVLSSVIAELQSAGPVALFTPYVAELTATIASSLRAAGIDVVSEWGLGISRNLDIGMLAPADIVGAVQAFDVRDAQTLFCSCTNLRAFEALPQLAASTGRHVVTSNQAVVSQLEARFGRSTVGTGSWSTLADASSLTVGSTTRRGKGVSGCGVPVDHQPPASGATAVP